jgi:hypothetical protein
MLETLEIPEFLTYEEYEKKLTENGYSLRSDATNISAIKSIFSKNFIETNTAFLVSPFNQTFYSSEVNERIHGFDCYVQAVFEFLLRNDTKQRLYQGKKIAFPLANHKKTFWIYARYLVNKLTYYFNDDKETIFGDEWEIIQFKQTITNNLKTSGGSMFEKKNIKCIPFKVTTYPKSIGDLISDLESEGVCFDIKNPALLEVIVRPKIDNRIINPFSFYKVKKGLIINLMNVSSDYSHFWDFDAMSSIAKDLKKSEENSKIQYVSLVTTLNGRAGTAVCTVQRNQQGVELGLYFPEELKQIFSDENHPIYGEILAFPK